MSAISKIRRAGYPALRYLGDAQAVEKALKTGTAKPIEKRIERRVLGRTAGQLIRLLTK